MKYVEDMDESPHRSIEYDNIMQHNKTWRKTDMM